MSKFRLNYANGTSEEVITDAVSAEDQVNRTFGMSLAEAKDMGCSVDMLELGGDVATTEHSDPFPPRDDDPTAKPLEKLLDDTAVVDIKDADIKKALDEELEGELAKPHSEQDGSVEPTREELVEEVGSKAPGTVEAAQAELAKEQVEQKAVPAKAKGKHGR